MCGGDGGEGGITHGKGGEGGGGMVVSIGDGGGGENKGGDGSGGDGEFDDATAISSCSSSSLACCSVGGGGEGEGGASIKSRFASVDIPPGALLGDGRAEIAVILATIPAASMKMAPQRRRSPPEEAGSGSASGSFGS